MKRYFTTKEDCNSKQQNLGRDWNCCGRCHYIPFLFYSFSWSTIPFLFICVCSTENDKNTINWARAKRKCNSQLPAKTPTAAQFSMHSYCISMIHGTV